MGAASARRAAAAKRPMPVADMYVLPAPTGGLNSRDAQAAMPETDALIMDNLVPQQTWVEIRGGSVPLATFTGTPYTLFAYNALGSGVPQLFSSVNNGGVYSIYRVDNAGGGAVGAAVVGGGSNTVQALTSGDFDYNQFGAGAAEVVYALNGTDAPLLYDGTTWYAMSASSSPYALTNGPSPLSQLSQVAVYQKRLWFVQAGTFNVYYLPQNVFAGALTLLPLAPNFKLGGFLTAIITISIDDSSGNNDYIAFMSNQGEIVMFTGYDPASVSTFSLSAVFRIGPPIGLGRKSWQKIGMDAAVICQDGFVLLSEALLTDRSQQKGNLSDKVRYGINQNMQLYGTYAGWMSLLFPAGNKLLFIVPTAGNRTTSFTYVMNTLNGSWCTWGQMNSALNMTCMENFNNKFYFGAPGGIFQGDTGLSDISLTGSPKAIIWTAKQAYSYMGANGKQKRWTMAQPFFQTSGGLSIAMTISSDYDTTLPSVAIPLSVNTGAVWGSALWNAPTYWGDAQQIVRKWVGLQGVGFAGSIIIQGATQNLAARWQMTNVMFEPGGSFYGP